MSNLEPLTNYPEDESDKDISSALEALAALSSVNSSIEETNSGLEPKFIRLADQLESVFSDSSRLADKATGAASLAGTGKSHSIFTDVDDLARRSLTELERNQSEINQRLDLASKIASELGELRTVGDTLNRIARQLRVIATYFAIEGSRLPSQASTFSIFNKELIQLACSISEMADKISLDSRKAELSQLSARQDILDGALKLIRLASSTNTGIRSMVNDIEKTISASGSILEQIANHSKEIRRLTSTIVVAIQFRDITRQQIEHIVSALNDVQRLYEEACEQGDASAELGKAYAILDLQAAQLRQVISSIQRAHGTIDYSFRQIGQEALRVADCVTSLSSCGSHQENPFQGLEKLLVQLQEVLDKGNGLVDLTCAAVGRASQVSTTLSHHVNMVSTVNSDLKLKALNAMVKSVRLQDQGRALTTLAQEVMKLSVGCNDFVEGTIGTLQSIMLLAEESRGLSIERSERSADSITQQMNNGMQRLSANYNEFLSESDAAIAYTEKLQEAIDLAGEGLSFFQEFIDELSTHLSEIDAISGVIRPWFDTLSIDASAVLEQQAERYTMQTERDVFLQTPEASAFDGVSEVFFSSPTDSSDVNSADDDSFGDNIELF